MLLCRLKLKDQIVLFNHLLEQQVQIYHKIQQQGWVPPTGAQYGFTHQLRTIELNIETGSRSSTHLCDITITF